jgi:hypothetical protein
MAVWFVKFPYIDILKCRLAPKDSTPIVEIMLNYG